MRATISDIAREAGVSTATVDRVLHGRASVKLRTRSLVLSAAERLGYAEPVVTAARQHQVDFILPGGTNAFITALAGQIEAAALRRKDEVAARLHPIEGFNVDLLAAKLHEIENDSSGVALVALDHPTVREAIRQLTARGIPVLTLVSDISNVPRIGYVGIDNRAAGRLAGHLLGRFMGSAPGKVALFAGSLSYRGHEEREMGFRHILAEEFPAVSIVELREVRDDIARAYGEARALLEKYDDLSGIYNAGAGNRGIARALEESGRAREVVFVAHELTEFTRKFLLSGTIDAVIDQNPRVEAREAIDWLLRAARREGDHVAVPVRIQAIFRENIPDV